MPRCIWQTTKVTIKPLIEVDEAFAWDEGEGDRTRTSWLNGHRRYSARQASREGFAIDDQIPTVFERFKAGFPEDADRVRGAVRNRGGLPGLLDRGAYLDEFAFRHNRRKTRGVGRIAARVIERLVARQPLTMRTLIDDTRRCRWFRSAQPA